MYRNTITTMFIRAFDVAHKSVTFDKKIFYKFWNNDIDYTFAARHIFLVCMFYKVFKFVGRFALLDYGFCYN